MIAIVEKPLMDEQWQCRHIERQTLSLARPIQKWPTDRFEVAKCPISAGHVFNDQFRLISIGQLFPDLF